MSKNMYHSELVKMSPCDITVKTEVRPSKYPDKPDWIGLDIGGVERYLSIENSHVAEFFAEAGLGPVRVHATGNRDDAMIVGVDFDQSLAPVAPRPAPAAPPRPAPARPVAPAVRPAAAPAAAPAPTQRQVATFDDVDKARKIAERTTNAWEMIMRELLARISQFPEEVSGPFLSNPAALQAACATCMISSKDLGILACIPAGVIMLPSEEGQP